MVSPQEKDVGIERYLNEDFQSGLRGIVKHRYSDFNVNEVDSDSNVVRLTCLDLPEVDVVKQSVAETCADVPSYGSLEEAVKSCLSALNFAKLTKIGKKYAEDSQRPPDQDDQIKVDVTGKSKEDRHIVHSFVRKYFPHLASDTEEDGGGKKHILISYKLKGSSKRNDATEWPRERKEHFLHFTLYKEDMDQAAVLGNLTKILRIRGSPTYSFKVSGTKDKRARTSQRVAIKFVMAERLRKAVETLKKQRHGATSKVAAGNYCYRKSPLELGDLTGNRFTIVLRNIDTCERLGELMDGLRDDGFINYFGLQRFGSLASVKTSDVGLAMVKGDWSRAVELIMFPRTREKPWIARARNHWWMYRHAADALMLLGRGPETHFIEGCLLKGLSECHENDVVGALGYVPKNSRMMYLHAYQALVWNKAVSRRLAEFGKRVLVGDLVLLPEGELGNLFPEGEGTRSASEDGEVQDSKRRKKEKRLSLVEDEKDAERFTIEDVVMPIPGHRVPYPKHERLQQFYRDLLEADGLEGGFEGLKRDNEVYSLAGDYRKVVAKPTDLQWRVVKYSDPNKTLAHSDLDLLNNAKTIESDEDGRFEAMILELSLRSSSYATMALREVMRCDTGKSQQAVFTSDYINAAKEESSVDGAKRPAESEEEEEVQPKKVKSE